MTRGIRRLLFYLSVLAFIAIGTSIVFYADGWRFDPTTFSFNKVGAIYIRSTPSDTTVFINDEPIRRRFQLFDTGIFAGNLFPKRYSLRIEKEGYLPWKRTVEVLPSLVTELSHIVLVPSIPDIAARGVDHFWMLGSTPLLQRSDDTLIWRERALPGTTVIGWTDDINRLLTQGTSSLPYWIDLPRATPLSLAIPRRTPQGGTYRVHTLRADSSRVLLSSTSSLLLFDVARETSTAIVSLPSSRGTITHFAAAPEHIAWAQSLRQESSSLISLYNIFADTITSVIDEVSGAIRSLSWSPDGTLLAILRDGGDLFIYDTRTSSLALQANDVVSFSFSGDGTMLAALEQQSLELFSLRSDNYWRFNIPHIGEALSTSWYRDNRHLFIHFPEEIVFLDLGDRGLEQVTPVARTPHGEYLPQQNALYYLENGTLSILRFPS